MEGNIIQIQVVKTNGKHTEPWNMTIQNNEDIKAYMTQGKTLLFNFRGDIYEAYDITEQDFLKLVPHLDKHQKTD